MVRRILTTILLTSLLSFGAEYQLANRVGFPLGRNAEKKRAAALSAIYPTNTFLTGYMANPTNMLDYSAAKSDVQLVEANCATLDGVGDYCSITNIPCVGRVSVGAWIRTTSTAGIRVVSQCSNVGLTGQDFALRVASGNAIFLTARDGTAQVTTGAAVNDGKWHYVVGWDDGTNNYISVDGVTTVGTNRGGRAVSSNSICVVGRFGKSIASEYFVGDIAYAWVSTSGEYNPSNKNIILPMAGGAGMGTTEPDVSGNGNHGTWTTGAGGVTTLRSGKQDVLFWNRTYGCNAWTNGTYTAYVPYRTNGVPALTNLTGYALSRAVPKGYVSGYDDSIVIGGVTNTYDNILTNGLYNITTNANGVTELWK